MASVLDVIARIATVMGAVGGVLAVLAATTQQARRRKRIMELADLRDKIPKQIVRHLDALHSREAAEYLATGILRRDLDPVTIFGGFHLVFGLVVCGYVGLKGSHHDLSTNDIISGITGIVSCAAASAAVAVRAVELAARRARLVTFIVRGYSGGVVEGHESPAWASLGLPGLRVFGLGAIAGAAGACTWTMGVSALAIMFEPHVQTGIFVGRLTTVCLGLAVCASAITALARVPRWKTVVKAREKWEKEVAFPFSRRNARRGGAEST